MLIMAMKPGHDGSVALLENNRLVLSLEAEKDSVERYSGLLPATMLAAAEHIGELPDVVALGGWYRMEWNYGVGYHGFDAPVTRSMSYYGKQVEFFSSSHERSHIMSAIGMAPRGDHDAQIVLVWEGSSGGFHLLDSEFQAVKTVPVLRQPGARYAFLYALAEPKFPDSRGIPGPDHSGKLMALAAYGDPRDATAEIRATVDRILAERTLYPAPKGDYRDTPLYNVGVESAECKTAAALLSQRIFETFAEVAQRDLPAGLPLRISGGCGLNCDWNAAWRNLGHFSSVFVPPCANDSGSAIGTAIDALHAHTGDPHIEWSVYAGLEFEWDAKPASERWTERKVDLMKLAEVLADGEVIAWVQGRWEIGPRALGNRSLLAEPFSAATKDRLNHIKQRESYRPIAPVCRVEDLAAAFVESFEDPYMLYFRNVRNPELAAVTHVDGSARAQTVTRAQNAPLYDLLTAFAARRGIGVLCNTSLNFKGYGFINRMSDLARYCEDRGVRHMVVGDTWFSARESLSDDG
jgi:hydroxymethyl cephem carbamoyltransferase